ncbi:MAG: 30S ribosomal protein S5 [Patescibacteria group bacterium]
MNDDTNIIPEEAKVETVEETAAAVPVAEAAAPAASKFPPREQRKNERDRKPRREPRAKPEYDQRILNIRRVTRVSAGGRRFSFSVALVTGNHKGSVGVGTGKAGDTSLAIDKAFRNAKKNAITLKTTSTMSIAHEVFAKDKSARVHIQPAKGKGIIAGSSVRDVIELAGLKDISAKLHSPSKNKLNAARATIKALSMLKMERVKAESAK